MKSRRQQLGVRSQWAESLQTVSPPTVRRRAGFTLVEMLLAVSISLMVFVAMGSLLSKCFSLWMDATANWQLAQVARISRERILTGGFTDPSGGLLSATNATINPYGSWDYIEYVTVAGSGVVQQVYGWRGTAEENLWLKKGVSTWAYGQGFGSTSTRVKVDSFSAAVSNEYVLISYRLRLSAAGKTFTLPHTINACLVNKE